MSLTIRERQIKCDTTTHLLECLKKKKKNLALSSADKDAEQLEL